MAFIRLSKKKIILEFADNKRKLFDINEIGIEKLVRFIEKIDLNKVERVMISSDFDLLKELDFYDLYNKTFAKLMEEKIQELFKQVDDDYKKHGVEFIIDKLKTVIRNAIENHFKEKRM